MSDKPFGGTIENWEIVGTYRSVHKLCLGDLHGDPNKRFPEGYNIHTSNLVAFDKLKGEIETLNTKYKLGKPLATVPDGINTTDAIIWELEGACETDHVVCVSSITDLVGSCGRAHTEIMRLSKLVNSDELENFCAAVDFFDKVIESPKDDQVAVGRDHHDRLHKASWDLRDAVRKFNLKDKSNG